MIIVKLLATKVSYIDYHHCLISKPRLLLFAKGSLTDCFNAEYANWRTLCTDGNWNQVRYRAEIVVYMAVKGVCFQIIELFDRSIQRWQLMWFRARIRSRHSMCFRCWLFKISRLTSISLVDYNENELLQNVSITHKNFYFVFEFSRDFRYIESIFMSLQDSLEP